MARAHQLTADDIAAALGVPSAALGEPLAALGEPVPTVHAPSHHGRDVIVRVLGYLGGTFIFAGICILSDSSGTA